MSDEDKELEILKAKRLLEMQKNISLQQKQEELKATKDRKSTRLNSSHIQKSRMPSSA